MLYLILLALSPYIYTRIASCSKRVQLSSLTSSAVKPGCDPVFVRCRKEVASF
jgi:hypothetical protein